MGRDDESSRPIRHGAPTTTRQNVRGGELREAREASCSRRHAAELGGGGATCAEQSRSSGLGARVARRSPYRASHLCRRYLEARHAAVPPRSPSARIAKTRSCSCPTALEGEGRDSVKENGLQIQCRKILSADRLRDLRRPRVSTTIRRKDRPSSLPRRMQGPGVKSGQLADDGSGDRFEGKRILEGVTVQERR